MKCPDAFIHSFMPSPTHLAAGEVLGAGVVTLDEANGTCLRDPFPPMVATSQLLR